MLAGACARSPTNAHWVTANAYSYPQPGVEYARGGGPPCAYFVHRVKSNTHPQPMLFVHVQPRVTVARTAVTRSINTARRRPHTMSWYNLPHRFTAARLGARSPCSASSSRTTDRRPRRHAFQNFRRLSTASVCLPYTAHLKHVLPCNQFKCAVVHPPFTVEPVMCCVLALAVRGAGTSSALAALRIPIPGLGLEVTAPTVRASAARLTLLGLALGRLGLTRVGTGVIVAISVGIVHL